MVATTLEKPPTPTPILEIVNEILSLSELMPTDHKSHKIEKVSMTEWLIA